MILALDYGTKRIGVAISDETETVAFRHEPIIEKDQERALGKIKQIVEKKSITKIILGLPLGIEQKPTQMSKEVEKFAEIINKRTGIKAIRWDESVTSQLAKENMGGINRKSGIIDSESARIILQEYLNIN